MDKHQRKYLARWEMNKAKRQEKFEERMRDREFEATVDSLEAYAASYEPDMTGFLTTALPTLESLRGTSIFRYMTLESHGYPRWVFWRHGLMRERYAEIVWWRNVKFDERTLERVVDVEASKKAIRDAKTGHVFIHRVNDLQRQLERTTAIRDELLHVYPRWRAILNCKVLKEEIMMAAWHPRRVEHILVTYGWDAYDNLLGV